MKIVLVVGEETPNHTAARRQQLLPGGQQRVLASSRCTHVVVSVCPASYHVSDLVLRIMHQSSLLSPFLVNGITCEFGATVLLPYTLKSIAIHLSLRLNQIEMAAPLRFAMVASWIAMAVHSLKTGREMSLLWHYLCGCAYYGL
jgi:hypothetical protein